MVVFACSHFAVGSTSLLMVLHAAALGTSILLSIIFKCDFSDVKPTGKYAVGHLEMFAEAGGNAISVFYPVDPTKRNPMKSKLWLQSADKFTYHMEIAEKWSSQSFYKWPAFHARSWRKLRIDAETNAPLADDFTAGKKLIPIVWSHGLVSSR